MGLKMENNLKVVTIAGEKVPLERRICLCGCGISFWVTPDSKQFYAREFCPEITGKKPRSKEYIHKQKQKVVGIPPYKPKGITEENTMKSKKKAKTTKKKVKLNTKLTDAKLERTAKKCKTLEAEEQWNKYVRAARVHVRSLNKHRMAIAELAIKACDIKWGGGGHWSGFKGQKTIKEFALAVGVHRKTLGEWVSVKRNVVDKLPKGIYIEEDYAALQRTKKKTNRGTPAAKVIDIYNQEISRGADAYVLAQVIKRTKSYHTFICVKGDLDRCDREELTELKSMVDEMSKRLGQHLQKGPDEKSKDNVQALVS